MVDTAIPEYVDFARRWTVEDPIGSGGFGQVFGARDEHGAPGAIKFVPALPGADRELLLTELEGRENVVAVLDHGEADGYHVIVMPRGEKSLRQRLNETSGPLAQEETREVARDISVALAALAPDVVHRDLKPENVLLLDHTWMLTDFGISRYVDASTSTNTRSAYLTAPYAAPERWRNERATSATDVYALGVMMYEMLAGEAPFEGTLEELADAHQHTPPPPLTGVSPAWASLVDECLSKSTAARPSVENLLMRLERMSSPDPATGLGALAAVGASVARDRVARDAEQQRRQQQAAHREQLYLDAVRRFENLAASVMGELRDAAPSGDYSEGSQRKSFTLGRGQLVIVGPRQFDGRWRSPNAPVFDVVAFGHVLVEDLHAKERGGYYGRSHSLWFGDIQQEGAYGWFETAFMETAGMSRTSRRVAPLALDADDEHAPQAVWSGIAHVQVAWPFEPFSQETVGQFTERWSAWLAQASEGRLSHPSTLPERRPEGSWRAR